MVPNMVRLTVLVVLAAAAVSTQNYCSICSDHTMCRYSGVGRQCSPRLGGGVNAAARTAILKIHNYHRQQVARGRVRKGAPGPQPQASNMRVMVWNKEIAAIAQRWADQCSYGHDSCRKVNAYSVGQNVYTSSTTGTPGGPDWKRAIDAFASEVKDFNRSWVSPFKFSSAIGHYSQVVWATTNTVGCGYSVYKNPSDPKRTRQFYVCNYGPAGNIKGREMYKKGKPCSKCPGSCSKTYPGLCA